MERQTDRDRKTERERDGQRLTCSYEHFHNSCVTLGYTDNQGSPLIFVCSIDITVTLKKNNNIQCYYIVHCILHHYLWNNKLYTTKLIAQHFFPNCKSCILPYSKIQKISQNKDLIWHTIFSNLNLFIAKHVLLHTEGYI